MKSFFGPAQVLMQKLPFKRKFGLISVLLIIPILALLIILVVQTSQAIEFAARERMGFTHIVKVIELVREVQLHRGLSLRQALGDSGLAEKIGENSARMKKALDELSADWATSHTVVDPQEHWTALRVAVEAIRSGKASGDPMQDFARHNALVAELLRYIGSVADDSNLTLDPVGESDLLVDATINQIPTMNESLGQMRAYHAIVPEGHGIGGFERDQVLVLNADATRTIAATLADFDKAAQHNPAVADLAKASHQGLAPVLGFIQDSRSRLASDAASAKTQKEWFGEGTEAIDAAIGVTKNAGVALDGLLSARIKASQEELSTILITSLLFILVATYLVIAFYRSVNNGLRKAVRCLQEIARGRLDVRVEAKGGDEIGELMFAMRQTIDVLSRFAREQAELARRQKDGQLTARIDGSSFEGSYGLMAGQTNCLVEDHVMLIDSIIGVVQSYSEGDFKADLAELPGEQIAISSAIAAIKARFRGINAEVSKMVTAAADGDFSARADSALYGHDFRLLIEGLNRLMQVSQSGLGEVDTMLAALAEGDLTVQITTEYGGLFAHIAASGNRTAQRLSDILTEVEAAAETIAVATGQIAQGNADLSSRTEHQAANLEETAASMEELTATVKQNGEHTEQASHLSASAAQVAGQGGALVAGVVTTMGEIAQSSKKIFEIISVIDGIAFQTNILALNAAVEAARAGDQGLGFAVVAAEVRNLAQRSAEAARQIKALISDSVRRVDAGTKLVDAAGSTMRELVESVERVHVLMSEISQAGREQGAGIEQVNQAIAQMDSTTQQNAALVEEAAAAAESLQDQARGLESALQFFRLARSVPERASQPTARRSLEAA